MLRIRLDGAEFHDVVQYASEKAWNVGERQLWNYIAASDKLLAARREKDRDRLLARHVAQRRALYARSVNAADYRTALAVAKDEAELEGLYPAIKREVTGAAGGPIETKTEVKHDPSMSQADIDHMAEVVRILYDVDALTPYKDAIADLQAGKLGRPPGYDAPDNPDTQAAAGQP